MNTLIKSQVDLMKAFFKKIEIFILLSLIFFSCAKKESIYLLPTNYILPYQILVQDIRIEEREEAEIKFLNVKLWFKNGNARIEIKKQWEESKKTIIMDKKNFYIIDEKSKTAYMCSRQSDYALNFLGEVIINAGIGKTQDKITGTETILNKDCLIYSYNIFVQHKGIFCPALIKEYREKLNNNIVMIISEIKPPYLQNKKIIKKMEVIRTQRKFFLSDKLFKKTDDIKVIELKSLRK